MSGCDGYVCMGCGKCYDFVPKGKPGQGVCLVCGAPLDPDAVRCPHCGAPTVKPLDVSVPSKVSGRPDSV